MLRFIGNSDKRIVQRVLAGRRDDFGVLVKRYLPVVHAVGCAQMGNATDAEDVAQETFIRAFQSLDALRDPGKFGSWLLTITRNTCRNLKRAEARRSEREQQVEPAPPHAGPEIEREETRRLLSRMIQELEENAREILLLHYYGRKSVKEIAGLLDISVDAAKKRLQRAREALSQALLSELAPACEPKRDAKERAKQIMGAVAATSAPWQAAVSATGVATAGAATGGGVSVAGIGAKAMAAIWAHKLIVAAAIVVAGGASVLVAKGGPDADVKTRIANKISAIRDPDQMSSPAGQTTLEPKPAADSDTKGGDAPRTSLAAGQKPKATGEGHSLHCTVTYEDGRPAQGALVTAYRSARGDDKKSTATEPLASGETDSAGIVEFSGLEKRPYIVQASKGGLFAMDSTNFEESAALTLQEMPAITGVVRNARGEAVPSARVHPSSEPSIGWGEHLWYREMWEDTDADGAFVLEHLPGSAWRLKATAEGYADLMTEPIDLGERSAHLTLMKGATVSGTVIDAKTGAPVAGVKLGLGSVGASSDAEGAFLIEHVPPGNHGLRLQRGPYLAVAPEPRLDISDEQHVSGITVRVTRGGTISGRVYDAESGEGIEHCSVHVSRTDNQGPIEGAETDASGAYTVEGLRANAYTVSVSAPGAYPVRPAGTAETIMLSLGEQVTGVDFAVKKGIRVAGEVVDETGQPVEGADVMLTILKERFGEDGRRTSTSRSSTGGNSDEDGAFEFRVQPGSTFYLAAWTPEKVSELKGPIEAPASDMAGIILALSSAPGVSGRVVDSSGNPVSSAEIWTNTDLPLPVDQQIRSDGQGAFQIKPLLPGTYCIVGVKQEDRGGLLDTSPDEFTLQQGQQLTNLILTVDAIGGLSISGRVRDTHGNPVPSASVWAQPGRGMQHARGARTTADATGTYTVTGLQEGAYDIHVNHDRYAYGSAKEVAAGTRNVEVVLEGLARIEGQVVRADTGQPLESFSVGYTQGWEQPRMDTQLENRLDAEGRFVLDKVQSGSKRTVAVIARAPGFAPSYAVANVTPDETTANVVVRLEPSAVIEGVVTDASGNPVEGAFVFLDELPRPLQEPWLSQKADARTDQDGSFRFDTLDPSTSVLYVVHGDYAPAEYPIALTSSVVEAQIVMSSGAAIEGVVSMDGVPMADQRVQYQCKVPSLATHEQPRGDTQTDSSGYYRFDKVMPGEVELSVEFANVTRDGNHTRSQGLGVGAMRRVLATEGQTTVVNLAPPEGSAVIEGRVTLAGAAPGQCFVLLQQETPDGRVHVQALVDADGGYRLERVPAGHASLYFGVQGERGERFGRKYDIDVEAGQTMHLDVQLDGTGTVVGTLAGLTRDEAYLLVLPGSVAITPETLHEPGWLMTTTVRQAILTGNGPFRVEGLPEGTHTILVGTDGLGSLDSAVVDIPENGEVEVALTLP